MENNYKNIILEKGKQVATVFLNRPDVHNSLNDELINELFEDKNALEIGVNSFIENYIVPRSASSLRYGVKASRAKFNHILSNFLQNLELMYVNQLMNTNDANEGINSFIEKRKPNWKNN